MPVDAVDDDLPCDDVELCDGVDALCASASGRPSTA